MARLIVGMLPWIPLLIAGVRETWLRATMPGTPARLILVWAIVPVMLVMLLGRRQMDFVLPMLAPWAVIFAFGLQRMWKHVHARFPDSSGAVAFRNLVILVAVIEIALLFVAR